MITEKIKYFLFTYLFKFNFRSIIEEILFLIETNHFHMQKNLKILSVDLDQTLIKTDLLFETFWSSFSNDLTIPLKALLASFKGKAYLRKLLLDSSSLDIKSLPYNNTVIEYISTHRANGGKVALVTDINQKIVNSIADHLSLFDEVYSSSSLINFKGSAKRNILEQIYGKKNFDYIGNSSKDIQIWEISNKAITFNAGKSLKRKCELINSNSFHLVDTDKKGLIASFLKEIRIYQWIKNILIFIPLIAAQDFDKNTFFYAFLSFFSFSITASSVYILNDLLDIKADRNHPIKCKRPFASGDLPLNLGSILGLLLLLLGLTISFTVSKSFVAVLLAYYGITFSYSIYLKRKALVDIFILSGLYTLRLLAGSTATNVNISFWLLVFSIFIFLSLAAIKRQSELIDLKNRGNIIIENRGYQIKDLDFIRTLGISSGLISILVLILYLNSSMVLVLYSYPQFLWISCFFFLFWFIRICLKTDRGEMKYDPIIFAFKDRVSNYIFGSIILLLIFSNIL